MDEETALLSGPGRPITTFTFPAATRSKIVVIIVGLYAIFEIGSCLQGPPTLQLLEEIICTRTYVNESEINAAKNVCKSSEVVSDLANFQGWQESFDCLVPFIISIPYGIMADRYGRQPVLFMSLLGCTLEACWIVQPLLWPTIFPLWTRWFGSGFKLIGGGRGMIQAMVLTVVSDVTDSSKLTTMYYIVDAVAYGTNFIALPLSLALMRAEPWIPLLISVILMSIGTCLSLSLPETRTQRQASDFQVDRKPNRQEHHLKQEESVVRLALSSFSGSFRQARLTLLGSKTIQLLAGGFVLTFVADYLNTAIMAKYLHTHAGWSWSKTTVCGSSIAFTHIMMLLVILPIAALLFSRWRSVPEFQWNIWLARISGILLCIGYSIVGVAPTSHALLITGLLVSAIGSCHGNICRVLLSTIVQPDAIGALTTTILWVQQISLVISGPAVSGLFKAGNQAGGIWFGLPYGVAAVLSIIATGFVCICDASFSVVGSGRHVE
ncbi:ATP synthase F0 [Colletotrichum chrysophilum]|uniref:ATP synthase F0 n=1 Tax=Colletotrichum chrysophilum TaxID=1836956 RepID=A0AAD8ZXH8_9PEZI|nr:ATP synthase F0 [Colletotrichum chrysophilum]